MTVIADTSRQVQRPDLPELGQVVEVRGATWAVTNIREQGLLRSPADETYAGVHHLVSMQSLEEDRLSDELTVVWELEVGHVVAPDQGLPESITTDRFDDPNTLAAFVDAVRWGAVTSADENTYQAPFRSGANVEAYQLEPLRRALHAPRTNLLLADDVGLGKTIEAGLVIQELLLRHRARSVIIVCPPSLSLKWQDEMREKFGLEFVIVNSERMAEVRRTHGLAANPFRLFPRVIVSMAWLPQLRAQRLLRDIYAQTEERNSANRYAFDILVVDEAHHVAPSSPSAVGGGRGYAVDSQRTIATRALAEKCEHRLFLSATPHNGHSESFTALLEMIDDRRFSRGADLDEKALRDVTVRRLKAELPEQGFQPRIIKSIAFTPSHEEQEAFAGLDRILSESARANQRGRSGDIVSMLLKKRFLSSPFAFGSTMSRYLQAAVSGELPVLDDEDSYYQEVLGSGQSDEEEGLQFQPEFTSLRHSKGSDALVAATTEQIEALTQWGLDYEHKPDSRLTALISMLDSICRPDGRTWTNERVVVFTEYADTLDWIVDVLTQHGYGDVLETIQGSTPPEDREDVRARFSADPVDQPVRVLVATDSAGEGIDLQAHCHRLVNFDVPFNPSRLEQRIGRIDRYGQRYAPEIFHFVPDATASTYGADMDFVRRIAEKVGQVAQDLGSVNQVIDADVQAHFGRASLPAARSKAAVDGNAIITRTLAGGMALNRQLTELARTYDDTKIDMHLTPGNLRRVVDTALELSSQPLLNEVGDDRTDAQVFEVPDLGPAWHDALRGLDSRLEPGVYRPITFDDHAAEGRDDLVHVHLGHGLMQKSARMLRSSLFSSDTSIHRVSAVVVDGLGQSCVAAVSRLVLVGRGGTRLHEEVFLTGIRIRGQAMAEAKVEDLLDEALDATNLELADARLREHLVAEWNAEGSRLRERLETAVKKRAESRQEAVADRLQEREESDAQRAHDIFASFRRNLRDSHDRLLKEEEDESMMLFADDQRAQRRRDIRAMEERLESLDEEEAREIEGIEARYAEVEHHVSAAALLFAITPEDASGWKVGA
ncbi:DISARM system SNF2-like helicase DrmD [Ornithinimicrobium cryptoxanthini]|uniref:DISARM system SNF2-like helicase DrmD n=1 Tax=Ornithinimicrobium cryptoxanthini TaxID=2934161 RepID=UPI002117DC2C|nr:DISARM system SNF2-like helicase DrmD [Ornithinimicrobium cryptoxanthini]